MNTLTKTSGKLFTIISLCLFLFISHHPNTAIAQGIIDGGTEYPYQGCYWPFNFDFPIPFYNSVNVDCASIDSFPYFDALNSDIFLSSFEESSVAMAIVPGVGYNRFRFSAVSVDSAGWYSLSSFDVMDVYNQYDMSAGGEICHKQLEEVETPNENPNRLTVVSIYCQSSTVVTLTSSGSMMATMLSFQAVNEIPTALVSTPTPQAETPTPTMTPTVTPTPYTPDVFGVTFEACTPPFDQKQWFAYNASDLDIFVNMDQVPAPIGNAPDGSVVDCVNLNPPVFGTDQYPIPFDDKIVFAVLAPQVLGNNSTVTHGSSKLAFNTETGGEWDSVKDGSSDIVLKTVIYETSGVWQVPEDSTTSDIDITISGGSNLDNLEYFDECSSLLDCVIQNRWVTIETSKDIPSSYGLALIEELSLGGGGEYAHTPWCFMKESVSQTWTIVSPLDTVTPVEGLVSRWFEITGNEQSWDMGTTSNTNTLREVLEPFLNMPIPPDFGLGAHGGNDKFVTDSGSGFNVRMTAENSRINDHWTFRYSTIFKLSGIQSWKISQNTNFNEGLPFSYTKHFSYQELDTPFSEGTLVLTQYKVFGNWEDGTQMMHNRDVSPYVEFEWCRGGEMPTSEEGTPTPTPTSLPTSTTISTITSTPTPLPTSTPTLTPTITPIPTSTLTPTSTPTLTPTPFGVVCPNVFLHSGYPVYSISEIRNHPEWEGLPEFHLFDCGVGNSGHPDNLIPIGVAGHEVQSWGIRTSEFLIPFQIFAPSSNIWVQSSSEYNANWFSTGANTTVSIHVNGETCFHEEEVARELIRVSDFCDFEEGDTLVVLTGVGLAWGKGVAFYYEEDQSPTPTVVQATPTAGPSPTNQSATTLTPVSTYTPLPTLTPVSTYTPLPTYTMPPLPTITPTITPQAAGTPISVQVDTPTPQPTGVTDCDIIPKTPTSVRASAIVENCNLPYFDNQIEVELLTASTRQCFTIFNVEPLTYVVSIPQNLQYFEICVTWYQSGIVMFFGYDLLSILMTGIGITFARKNIINAIRS